MKRAFFLVVIFFSSFGCTLFAQKLPPLIPYRHCNKWGYCDSNKRIVVKPVYTQVGLFKKGYANVVKGRKHGRIDSLGNVFLPRKYDQFYAPNYSGNPALDYVDDHYYQDGYARVRIGTRYGMVDSLDHIVVPIIYEELRILQKGTALAWKRSKDGKEEFCLISFTNKVILPWTSGRVELVHAESENEDREMNLLAIQRDSVWSLWDHKGRQLTPFEFTYVNDVYFEYGLSSVQKGEMYGVIDTLGREVVPFIYDQASIKSYNQIAVRRNSKWGVLDRSGKTIIPDTCVIDPFSIKYSASTSFSTSTSVSSKKSNASYGRSQGKRGKDGKLGFQNKDGKLATQQIYEDVYTWNCVDDELFYVRKYGKWGYVDIHGTEYWKNSFFTPFLYLFKNHEVNDQDRILFW